MKIGIIGSGDVGQALGRGFAARGHDVKIGTRSPADGKLNDWLKEVGGKGSVGTFAEVAAFGEVLVLATTGSATENAVEMAGVKNFTGKLVIDATNPLDFSNGMPPGTMYGTTDSIGERLQKKLPQAHVVKAFNTVPNARMVDPKLPGVRMMIAGNNADAKKRVEGILRDFGWGGVIDLGGIEESRWLEAFVPLWVRAGIALGRWDHVFDVRM
ncbi:MAG TPA: NAD(P)-binding domain-containing protein [Candidatus Thermoplasmatota archaeon]|nr:NAD(P)-binding domain-containing protein [Candidatus Thermoplasmatota archaeon]